MAQPPPLAPPAIAKTPDTYLQRYERMEDLLQRSYIGYLEQYAAGNGQSTEYLMQKIHTSSNSLPKVFAGLVKFNNRYKVMAIHRPTMFASIPGSPTQWDDRVFAFYQDVDGEAGHYVDMVEFPAEAFDETEPHQIPTLGQTDLLLAADASLELIPVQPENSPDTEDITVRNMVPIPHRYIHLILNQMLSPREAWEQIGGAIRNDNAILDCDYLLQWLRVTLTSTAQGEPATYLGSFHGAFPALRVDRALQRHRWATLIQDFPQ